MLCRTHQIFVYLVPLLAVGFAWPVRDKRAFSYIANQTVCVVDSEIYRDGDPIPTDDPCESCKCRPPGFSCVLRECEVKPGCKAIRREGECCPEYQCGCEHNGKFFNDGDRIPNAESPCYSCYCQGSSITCALADCKFRFDCEPEYVSGECCPRYDHCPPDPSTSTLSSTSIYTTLPSTAIGIFSTNRTVEEEPQPTTTAVPSLISSTTVKEGSTLPPATEPSSTVAPSTAEPEVALSSQSSSTEESVTQPPPSSALPAVISEATLINEIPSETTAASVVAVGHDEVSAELEQGAGPKDPETPETPATTTVGVQVEKKEEPPIESNEIDPVLVIVTAKPISVGSEELTEEPYPTTKTWMPDTSLAAEHKESFDDLTVITTEIPAINADSLDSLVTENEINVAAISLSDNKAKEQMSSVVNQEPAESVTTTMPLDVGSSSGSQQELAVDIVNDVTTTMVPVESQTVSALTGNNINNSTDSLNINVIVS